MLKTFNEVFDDYTKYGTKIKTEQYHTVGTNIIIDQGQADIAGYTDQIDGLFKDVPVIVFGDHTRIIKYINRPFFLGADGTKILKSKIPNANYKYLYYALKNAKIPNTGYNRHFKWLKQISISFPEHHKQSMIVEILDKLEDSIDNYNTILGLLDKLVKARFIEMFGDGNLPIKTVKELCYCVVDCPHTTPKYEGNLKNPAIRTSEIKKGFLVWDTMRYVSDKEYVERTTRAIPKAGDIVYGREGTFGNAAILPDGYKFCLVFQNYNLIDYLTPLENVRLVNSKASPSILLDLGLEQSQINRSVMKLSGGQQQRVAIARALTSSAPIILADEPTGNLDSDTASEIIDILKARAKERNKCVIVVTHSKEVADAADVVYELKDKKLKKRGK